MSKQRYGHWCILLGLLLFSFDFLLLQYPAVYGHSTQQYMDKVPSSIWVQYPAVYMDTVPSSIWTPYPAVYVHSTQQYMDTVPSSILTQYPAVYGHSTQQYMDTVSSSIWTQYPTVYGVIRGTWNSESVKDEQGNEGLPT